MQKLITLLLSIITMSVAVSQNITGSGTAGYVPRFAGTTQVGNSVLFQNAPLVGINTTAPSALLHIKNSSSSVSPFLITNAANNAVFSVNDIGTVGINTTTPIAYVDVKSPPSDFYGWLYHGQNSSGNTRFLVAIDGRASIGGAPTYNQSILTLRSALGSSTATIFDMVAPSNTGFQNQLRFLTSNTTIRHLIADDYGTGNLLIKPGNGGGANNVVEVQGRMKIGNVTTPSANNYSLYVEKGILAESFKCAIKSTSDWSDYVFDECYQLRSLDEVEDYLTKNKHLPDVPSAEEMVKNGMDVAKTNALLLRKIEELTLYVIDLKKKFNE